MRTLFTHRDSGNIILQNLRLWLGINTNAGTVSSYVFSRLLQKSKEQKLHKDVATQCKINHCKNSFTTNILY